MCTERKATGYYVLAWFMFATMDPVTFYPRHSFGLPHTYLNIFLAEITGLFDGLFIIVLGHLTKMAVTPIKQNMFHYKL